MEKQRDAPKVDTKGEGPHSTSTSASTSTSKLFGAFTVPPCPSAIATTIGFIEVSYEFLQNLEDQQDETTTHFTDVESKLASLCGQIWHWVQTTLENIEIQIWALILDEILEFTSEFHTCIDVF